MSAIKIDKNMDYFIAVFYYILGGNNMGFLDVLQAAGNHLNESLPQKYEAMCKQAPDSGLLRFELWLVYLREMWSQFQKR